MTTTKKRFFICLVALLETATSLTATNLVNNVMTNDTISNNKRANTIDRVVFVSCRWDPNKKKVDKSDVAVGDVEVLTSNTGSKHTVLKDGYYVVNSDIEYQEYLDIDGDVSIILMDGKTMNAMNGIRIKTDKSLTIYGQKGNTGKIKADGSIGAKGDIEAGKLTIHGGIIECKGKSHNNAAIGAGNGDRPSSNTNIESITIYGGNITATAADGGAGIGSGHECKPHGPITIYGGTINAKGGDGAAGIGGGEESGNGLITIWGGNITAEGAGYAAAIGTGEDSHLTNDIYIYGGTVNAIGSKGGVALGLGHDTGMTFEPEATHDLYIQDATVTASGRSSKTQSGDVIHVRNFYVENSTVNLTGEAGLFDVDKAILGDNLSVTLDGKQIEKIDRESALRYGINSATIKLCDHPGASYKDNGDDTHSIVCAYCNGVTEPHEFVNQNGTIRCYLCGAQKSFTPQALWCYATNTLYFVDSQKEYQAGDKYDDQTIYGIISGDDLTDMGTQQPSWGLGCAAMTRVVFDKSFSLARPKSLFRWFANCRDLTTIEGIENLNTSECTTMYDMFAFCASLETINVNGFDMSKVEDVTGMFANCWDLKAIYCDNTWSGIENSESMFWSCISLKGSMGTVSYDDDNTNDITYANPTTGYFTNTGAVFAQALWCDGDKTLYFACPAEPVKVDDQYNGQTVTSVWSGGHVLSTGDTAPGWSTVKGEATNVVFDVSFSIARPTSLTSWFNGFEKLTTAKLNGLNVSEVQSAASMFSGCTKLTTLYCDSTWTIAKTEGMFTGCTRLKGAVNYDAHNDNGVMANPTTGYFTKKWTVELLTDGFTVSNSAPYTNETVTISGMGDSGSGIVSLIVTGQRTGNKITVFDNGDGTRAFMMPAEDVTVKEKIDITIYDGKDNSEVLKKYDGKTVNITYDRILKATDNGDGTWTSKAYTVCLPYEKDLQDEFWNDQVRLYELAIVNDDYEFVFNGVPTAIIEAGKPYLVVVDKETIDLSAEGVETQALPEQGEDDGVVYPSVEAWQNQDDVCGWWRGTYRVIDNEESTQLKAFLLNSDGKWRGTNNDTEAHRRAYIPTFRAYYVPKEFTDYWTYDTKFDVLGAGGDPTEMWYKLPENYEGDGDNTETGIRPVIRTIDLDGTDTYYDLQGRKLNGKPTRKGIYINNGNKIINK